MAKFTIFQQTINDKELPEKFPNPYGYGADTLSKIASTNVQNELEIAFKNGNLKHDFLVNQSNVFGHQTDSSLTPSNSGGRRFGVLISRDLDGNIGYTKAFSHSLAGSWQHPDFAPSIISESTRSLAAKKYALSLESNEIAQHETYNHELLNKKISTLKTLNQQYTKRIEAESRNHNERLQKHKSGNHEPEIEKSNIINIYRNQQKMLRKEWQKSTALLKNDIESQLQKDTLLKSSLQGTFAQINQCLYENTYINADNGKQERILNLLNKKKDSLHFYQDGADAVLPKLLHHAFANKLSPITFAEFWWGASPINKVLHHKNYYSVTRGTCRTLLDFQLQNIDIKRSTKIANSFSSQDRLDILYEDDDVLAINKPAGVLTVPGKNMVDSIHRYIQAERKDMSGPIIVHRLDLATSGVLLLAKNKQAHFLLQKQFIDRSIEKCYAAILAKCILAKPIVNNSNNQEIHLPLITDYKDKPRQMICHETGKKAATYWRYQDESQYHQKHPRVWLYPQTGRTHQLRIHCAHKKGLNAPIMGDALYGYGGSDRLMLHAQRIKFKQPNSMKPITINCPSPF